MSAEEVLAREWPAIRARIIDLAAALDRIDRAPGEADQNRHQQIAQSLELILRSEEANRVEQIQLLLGRDYVKQWRERFAEGNTAAEIAGQPVGEAS